METPLVKIFMMAIIINGMLFSGYVDTSTIPQNSNVVTRSGVNNVTPTIAKELQAIANQNERFANCIENLRFLEAQNRKLGSEMEELKSKWGKDLLLIKQKYETELAAARQLIDDLKREQAKLKIENNSLQETMAGIKTKLSEADKYHEIDMGQINKCNQQLSESEREVNTLRRTNESLVEEKKRDNDKINKLQQEVEKLRDANSEITNSSQHEQVAELQRQLNEAERYHEIDREQINECNQQLSDSESELNMLRKFQKSLEQQRNRDLDKIYKLQEDVDKLSNDLNSETFNHLDTENRRQTLEEELNFLKEVHEQELKQMAALVYRDTTAENHKFWKAELSQAIRDIKMEYDIQVYRLRVDLDNANNLKDVEVTRLNGENKKLVKQVSDLKGRLAYLEASGCINTTKV